MKTFLKYWLPVLLWAGCIFLISSLPGEDIPCFFYGQEIIFHIVEYMLLAILLNRALKNSGFRDSSDKPKRVLLVILLCLIYAIFDEIHQHFVPGRSSSIVDLLVDSFGIVLGSVIYRC